MQERKPQIKPYHPPPAGEEEQFDLLAPEPLPEDSDPPGRRRDPTPMRALVEQAVKRLKLPDQELWREELAQAWSHAVPPEFAAVVRPGKWEHGVLYLFVANNARLFELRRFHLKAIEAGLRQHFDATRLKQVRVMIDPETGK